LPGVDRKFRQACQGSEGGQKGEARQHGTALSVGPLLRGGRGRAPQKNSRAATKTRLRGRRTESGKKTRKRCAAFFPLRLSRDSTRNPGIPANPAGLIRDSKHPVRECKISNVLTGSIARNGEVATETRRPRGKEGTQYGGRKERRRGEGRNEADRMSSYRIRGKEGTQEETEGQGLPWMDETLHHLGNSSCVSSSSGGGAPGPPISMLRGGRARRGAPANGRNGCTTQPGKVGFLQH